MARHTSFRFTVAATPAVEATFARHAGVARFAYNQCLRQVKDRLDARRRDGAVEVPWSGFSLVNHINTWKRSPVAGRTWAVDTAGQVELVDVGLTWRDRVCAQVFEEAAIDLGRALTAYTDSKAGRRRGRRVGFRGSSARDGQRSRSGCATSSARAISQSSGSARPPIRG